MGEEDCPLKEVVKVTKEHGALLFVDEAHAIGFTRSFRSGMCQREGLTKDVDFVMATLSKSMASIGGVVACDAEFAPLLRGSRQSSFQACSPPSAIASALAAMRRLKRDPALSERLWQNTRYFRSEAHKARI